MKALAVALGAVGVAEVLLALLARRSRVTTCVAATAVSVGVAVAAAVTVGCGPGATVAVAASVAAETVVRAYARDVSARVAPFVLAALGALLATRFLTVGAWEVRDTSVFDRWATTLPYDVPPDRVAYVIGALVFLATAANTLVRLLLQSGGLAAGDAKAPGGGRVIGSLERVLIFGLAVAGEPTAATLVVSAKGILRFAEVRATPAEDIDRVTEYVLVGSLASYALALAFVPLALV